MDEGPEVICLVFGREVDGVKFNPEIDRLAVGTLILSLDTGREEDETNGQ